MKRMLAVLILLAGASGLRASSGPRAILVLPFENRSARPDLDWVSESFAETLSVRLAWDGRFMLGRGERDAAYQQLGIPLGTPLTLASIFKVAETLGVDWAVFGEFSVENDRLSARAQMLDVRRLHLSSPLEAIGRLQDLVELQTRLAWRLLATQDVNFTVSKEEDFRRQFPDIRLDAHENFIRGILATDADSRVRFLREANRLNPADRRAALELGRHYFDTKDYENSARWLRTISPHDTNSLEALFMLGVDEFFLGREAAAEKAFLSLSQQIPLNEVWNNLGFLQARRGRLVESTTSFERAYRGDPTDATFCFNLGAVLCQQRKYPDAIRYLREAVRLVPDDPESHRLLGEALGAMGDSSGQQQEHRWLLAHEENANGGAVHDALSNLRLKKNYDGRAYRFLALAVQSALEERLQREPASRHADAHLARGRELLAAGRLGEAERECAEAASLLPQDSDTHLALAHVYAAQGRHGEAAAELETSLKLKNTVTGHLSLARVYLSLGQLEAAREHGQAALNLEPANHEAQKLVDEIPGGSPIPGRKP